jgi:MFS family permease
LNAAATLGVTEALRNPQLRDLSLAAVAIECTQQIIEIAWPVLLVAVTPDPVTQVVIVAVVEAGSEGAYLLAAPVLGALSDRRSPTQVIRCSALGVAVSCAMLPFAPSGWWLVPLALIADGASAGLHPPLLAEATRRVGPHDRSSAIGVMGAAVRAGSLLGALLSPALATFGPAVAVWAGSVGLASVGVAIPRRGGPHVGAALDR